MIEPRNPPGAPLRHVVEIEVVRTDSSMGMFRTITARLSCGHTREFQGLPRKRAAAMARNLKTTHCYKCAQERRESEG